MVSGISSSLSGLFAFSVKLSSTANNVANANTDGYRKATAAIVEDKNSLPRVDIEKLDTPGPIVQGTDGTVLELSNVELAGEFPQMMIARRGYEANIKALQIQDETLGSLLDIIG